MEPTAPKIRIFLGEFDVVEVLSMGAFRLKLGPGTTITIHLGDFPHRVKPGDRVPLFTEIPYDSSITASVQ